MLLPLRQMMRSTDAESVVTRVVDALSSDKGSTQAWQPAAIRLERTNAQTALTMWLGKGPELPLPERKAPTALVLGATIVGAIGVAVAASFNAQRNETKRLTAARYVGALGRDVTQK